MKGERQPQGDASKEDHMKAQQAIKPEGFEEHHRRKGDRQRTDLRGCDVIYVSPVRHKWIEEHPEEARKLGWSVSRSQDPINVPVVIPEAESTPKKPRFRGEARRKRRVLAIKVPKDTEDGGAVWDETLEEVKGKLVKMELYSEDDDIPVYEALIAALRDWLNTPSITTKKELLKLAKQLGIEL